jgi:hypothetical protein
MPEFLKDSCGFDGPTAGRFNLRSKFSAQLRPHIGYEKYDRRINFPLAFSESRKPKRPARAANIALRSCRVGVQQEHE